MVGPNCYLTFPPMKPGLLENTNLKEEEMHDRICIAFCLHVESKMVCMSHSPAHSHSHFKTHRWPWPQVWCLITVGQADREDYINTKTEGMPYSTQIAILKTPPNMFFQLSIPPHFPKPNEQVEKSEPTIHLGLCLAASVVWDLLRVGYLSSFPNLYLKAFSVFPSLSCRGWGGGVG